MYNIGDIIRTTENDTNEAIILDTIIHDSGKITYHIRYLQGCPYGHRNVNSIGIMWIDCLIKKSPITLVRRQIKQHTL